LAIDKSMPPVEKSGDASKLEVFRSNQLVGGHPHVS